MKPGDLSRLKEKSFTIKEGCQYRIKIEFKVQNEVVSGLRYIDAVYRKGVRGASALVAQPSNRWK